MAIPKFYSMLKSDWPEVFNNGGKKCDNLYLDMNCIFHICLRDAQSEKDLKNLILLHLQMVTAAFCPHRLLYIAIDGVPPIGKLKGQALRRQTYTPKNGLDPNALTPGTKLMEVLSQYVKDCTSKSLTKLDSDVKIIISDSSIAGEGEMKIVNHIREQHDQLKIVIYGIDADLIALGLSLNQMEVYLARQRYKRGVTTSRSRQCEYLNVSRLKYELICGYSSEEKSKLGVGNIINDIVLLIIIMGNDFLPKPEGLYVNHDTFSNSLQNLYEFHKKANETIVQDSKINKIVFKDYLADFIKNDLQIFKSSTDAGFDVLEEEDLVRLQLAGLSVSDSPGDLKRTEDKRLKEQRHFEEWKAKRYEDLLDTNQDKAEMFKEYYRGLHWVLRYYLSECPCYDYIYPYDNAPFLSDLADVYQDVEFAAKGPIDALHQLALVIPKKSSSLLPSYYRESKLYDQFSTVLTTSRPLSTTEVNKWTTFFKNELDPLKE